MMGHNLPAGLVSTASAVLEDYEAFFRSALKKFGVNSPNDFKSSDEKQKFFDYVDANFKGKDEKSKNEEDELEEKLEKERVKLPNGQRPKGPGWVLKKSGEQSGKDHSEWERKVKRVESVQEDDVDEEVKEDAVAKADLSAKHAKEMQALKDKHELEKSRMEGTQSEELLTKNAALEKKAVAVAKKMGGDMTGAVKEIEKLKKGLSKSSVVQKALRSANEEVSEEKVECPKCEGAGCDHCDDKGYHMTKGDK